MLNEQVVEKVVDLLGQQGLTETTVHELRNQFQGTHFTYCIDVDIDATAAYRECDGFNIYLVDSREHCSILTNDIENASGMVLAEVVEE